MDWAAQDWRTSRIRLRSIRTRDPLLRLVYLEILFALPESGGSISADPEQLEDLLGFPASVIEQRLPILEKYGREDANGGIVIANGRVTNRRVTHELEDKLQFRAAQRERALQSVAKRAEKPRRRRVRATAQPPLNHGSATAEQALNGGSATAEPIPIPSSSPIPSPIPIPLSPSQSHTHADPEGARVSLQEREEVAEVEFERIWLAYPEQGRKAKELAQRAWLEKLEFAPPLAEVLTAIIRQSKSEQWAKRKAVPNLDRWIREARWTDAVDVGDGATTRYKRLD